MQSGSAGVARSAIPTSFEREAPPLEMDVPVVEPASRRDTDTAHRVGGDHANAPEQLSAEATTGNKKEASLTVPTDMLTAIDDATRLLVYLTSIGDIPRPETIAAIFIAKKAIETNSWSLDAGRQFLEAFADISKHAKPITAKSLIESEGASSRQSIRLWSILVWILLPVLVFISALSFSNNRFSENIDTLIKLTYLLEDPNYIPSAPSDNLPGTGKSGDNSTTVSPHPQGNTEAHFDAVKEVILQLQINIRMLASLSMLTFLSGGSVDELAEAAKARTGESVENLRAWRAVAKMLVSFDAIVFGVINTYILPLLCALLGAAAYGLRYLSEQTLSRTYRASYTAYARAILAVIVGFAVGFFTEFTAKLSLQPLAVAFIAGYAVESFFIFLDTMLQAVQKPKG